ncbi:hypothetical protein C4D60_Mb04t37580 [Musa balbisiana]|uniref:Uncharacterized protein n=1 Tax=Musa balbisiana TaxID=52838 RepID=A0A4S8KHG8_MUSBA|nr:hypothetical protein C4D60_Mb04t37580 [Musa balbisiana]
MSALDLNQVCVIPIEERGHLPPYSCPDLFGVRHDERGSYCIGHHLHQPQQEPEEEFQIAGSSDEYMTQRPADPSDGITEEEPARPAALNGGLIPADAPSQVQKQKELDVDRTLPFKKRCKVDTASSMTATKLCFGEAKLSSNRSSAIKKVFPKEERDAAILLMALSCGLIRS